MKLRDLRIAAEEQGLKVIRHRGEMTITNTRLSIVIYHDDRERFHVANRSDVRLDLAQNIRSVQRCAEILGVTRA
jgi:hypothetical protein